MFTDVCYCFQSRDLRASSRIKKLYDMTREYDQTTRIAMKAFMLPAKSTDSIIGIATGSTACFGMYVRLYKNVVQRRNGDVRHSPVFSNT